MKKRTLTDRMVDYMETLENVSLKTNSELVLGFYYSLGMPSNINVSEWLIALSMKKYPTYESVVRAIRKARELNPEWRRPKKKELIDEAREEIGYSI
jgi:hypothetical protein